MSKGKEESSFVSETRRMSDLVSIISLSILIVSRSHVCVSDNKPVRIFSLSKFIRKITNREIFFSPRFFFVLQTRK